MATKKLIDTITDWNINTDIYDIANNIRNLQKRYIEDEDETTLSLGLFGFIGDTEAKKIQIATTMAGQLGNEMFPTRARLTKNVLAHAIYHGIEGINAVPAKMAITLCINLEDIETYEEDNRFYLDSESPIFIEEYEFHLDFDVMITRKRTAKGYSYSAQYIVTDENDNPIINRLSNITNPYLGQPFIINIGSQPYLGIQAIVRQCTVETVPDTLTSDSLIENKSYTFHFENQLADFNVTIIEGDKEYHLTPYIYGTNADETELYCWYLYVADDTIRITFDSRSFMPSLNSEIYIKVFTTTGFDGNFEYLNIDRLSSGIYVDLDSDNYNYNTISCYLVGLTDSVDGSDRKNKEELQKLIPKAALARGSITTDEDLINYFDLINNDVNRLIMQKKVDNQLARVWYGYFLLKDDYNNIIPTNSIDLRLILNSGDYVICNDGRYILPAGTIIKYDTITNEGMVIDDARVPVLFSDQYYNPYTYYYMTIYNLVLCRDPLYAAFYLTNCNYNSFFKYDYVNYECEVQFVANRFHFERKLLYDQDVYSMSFSIAQSINDETLQMYSEDLITYYDDEGNEIEEEVTTENIKTVLVFYREGFPYRWIECTLVEAHTTAAIYKFQIELFTDSMMDSNNNLKLIGANVIGSRNKLYGYFPEECDVDLYILAKLPTTEEIEYPRKDLDNIAPGYEDFVVTNVYRATSGIRIFTNYTNVLTTKVKVDDKTDTVYHVSGVPVVGRHYLTDEESVKFLIEAIDEKKDYIDYCLELIKNNMNIDFRYFNTYGPSKTYTIERDTDNYIGHIDIDMRLKVSLRDESDANTIPDIKAFIKEMIEDLNDRGDWHTSDLIQAVMNRFEDRIYFIEFVGFNEFDADDQHIILKEVEDPTTVPEFINIRNRKNVESNMLEPCIDIETVI